MILLALDTSTRSASVAVLAGEEVLAESSRMVPGTHSEYLMPEIDRMMRENGLALGDLDAVAVGLGPGSFTGTRIGLSTAKGLALGAGLSIVGISSLDAIARSMALTGFQVCPMLSAGKGEVYAALYGSSADGGLEKRTGDLVLTPFVLAEMIRETTIFVGGGALLHRDFLSDRLGGLALFAPSAQCLPRAAVIALLAAERLKEGPADDASGLAPNYVRKCEAEIQWMKRHDAQACPDNSQGELGGEECK